MPSTQGESSCPLETAYLSKNGFTSQINLALMACLPDYALFHRRTITSTVYREAVPAFPAVFPLFVIPSPSEASRNPMMPFKEWVQMVADARAGKCGLVVEQESAIKPLVSMGVDPVYYLPTLPTLPVGFQSEGKSQSDSYRVLLCSEAYPHLDLLRVVMRLAELDSQIRKPLQLVLVLGDGPNSVLEDYREGVVSAARELLGEERVLLREWGLRSEFLQFMARDVDAVVLLGREDELAYEAKMLKISVYHYEDNRIVSGEPPVGLTRRQTARRNFWSSLKHEPATSKSP